MKNLPLILGIILVVAGVLFTLAATGAKDKNNKSNINSQSSQSATIKSEEQTKVMSTKQYPSVTTVLPETERIGKKAKISTSMGDFTVELFGDKVPQAVSNFIFLAKEGFYDGLTFHRVIDGFMIQGGDPVGNGTGDAGYKFADEINPSLNFNKPGVLAYANSGKNTNGSQFFVTVGPTTWLNGGYTIFGDVIEGYETVVSISKVQRDGNDKPLSTVTIKKVEIL